MAGRSRLWLVVAWCLLVFGRSASPSLAGGGPEQVLLVVNPKSRDSLTIANHYVRLRNVPAENVFYLPWDPARERTDVETFRKEILAPILMAVEARRPLGRIDYVVYSSGFPWGVNTGKDVDQFVAAHKAADRESETEEAADREKDGGKSPDLPKPDPSHWPKQLTKLASINGLTYLCERVVTRNPAHYMGLNANSYTGGKAAEKAGPEPENVATTAFRSSDRFGPNPEPPGTAQKGPLDAASPGSTYLLSAMLGVTSGRGNTVEEVIQYLKRSAAADGTHPKGTVYYVKNSNIRSRTRHDAFPAAVSELEELGVAAEIVEGILPRGKDDVQGAMIGTAVFDWQESESTILPGAICEHLTSAGGVMSAGASQTPLSVFLRHGAAGASGTVTEPYAIQAKFPTPRVHVHYARGCTLAEAFYQSVSGPYQLLIVGDPLCRPWANVPTVRAEGVQDGAIVKGTLKLDPTATISNNSKVSHFELFVDGATRARCQPGESLDLDTTRLADGYHELRVIAHEAGPIASQGRRGIPVTTANHGREIQLSVSPQGTISAGASLSVSVKSPGSTAIALMHNTQLLGQIMGEEGQLEIEVEKLGGGPVRLHAVGQGKDGSPGSVVSAFVELVLP